MTNGQQGATAEYGYYSWDLNDLSKKLQLNKKKKGSTLIFTDDLQVLSSGTRSV